MKQKSFSLRFGIGSTIAIIVCCAGLALGYTTLKIGKSYFRQSLNSKIAGVALTTANLIDVKKHQSLKIADDETKDAYKDLINLLRNIKKSNPEVRFIYTLRMGEDKIPYFVLDAEENAEKLSHLGDKYAEASQPILSFLTKPQGVLVDKEFSSDQWGTFLSGYAAIGEGAAFDGLVGVDVSADYVLAAEKEIKQIVIVSTSLTVLIAGFFGFLLATKLTQPIALLTEEVRRIESLDLEDRPRVNSIIKEIDRLASATQGMKRGLTSFKKFVPSDLVKDLLKSGEEAKLGTQRKTITIIFSDIADFTTISEKLSSERLALLMDEYLGTVTDVIKRRGGTVDKFIGDAVMSLWGTPHDDPNHAEAACLAALECQVELEKLNGRLVARGFEPLLTRIGINTGEAIVGNIGTEDRLSYTAIGDSVNLASRVEGLNKDYGTTIMICESTLKALPEKFLTKLVDRVIVKGKTQDVALYELVGTKDIIQLQQWEQVKKHNSAMNAYISGSLDEAVSLMREIVIADPQNAVIALHLSKLEEALKNNSKNLEFKPRKMTSK